MTLTKQPASSFGPELLALLKKGSTEVVTLSFSLGKDAIRLRHRIHQLRAAMRRDHHPDWQQVYRAQVVLEGPHVKPGVPDPNKPQKLIVSPRDSEYTQVLKDAGVEVLAQNPVDLPLDTKVLLPEATDAEDPAEAFLSKLHLTEEKK